MGAFLTCKTMSSSPTESPKGSCHEQRRCARNPQGPASDRMANHLCDAEGDESDESQNPQMICTGGHVRRAVRHEIMAWMSVGREHKR